MNPLFAFEASLSKPVKPNVLRRFKEDEILLIKPDNYASIMRIVTTLPFPKFINAQDNYLLLADITSEAKKRITTLDYVISNPQMPGCCRIPERLLQNDVLLVNHMATDRDILLQEGHSVLCIDTDLVRDSLEVASNTIKLSLYANEATVSSVTEQDWQAINQIVINWGFEANE